MGLPSRILAASLVLCGTSLAFAPGCGGDDGPTVTRACATNPCQTRITLLHTSDIHSRLLPFEQVITQVDSDLGLGPLNEVANIGGVARMSYILGRERARADRVLHLDSGDCFQGAPIFNFYAGEPEVRALSLLGVDGSVVGNHEFDQPAGQFSRSGAVNVATQFQRWSSFPLLAANYKFESVTPGPSLGLLGTVTRPFQVFNRDGLKVAVIGMANLSTISSAYDQPNRLGLYPLNAAETAQFYVDMLRPHVDLVVVLAHLGLDVDQQMVRNTTGIDVVLGGHNHIVINPPQEIRDCSADSTQPGYIWAVDYRKNVDPEAPPPNDAEHPDPENHPWMFKRPCEPRRVIIAHSGSFSKYVGRLDLVLSNDPAQASPTGKPENYDPVNGFEVVSSKYTPFPVTGSTPEDPVLVEMLQPYRRVLDRVADLDILVGYSPQGARRFGPGGGDSPLGNLVATAIWLRLGVQTDFSLTNSTGIRADLNPGPITIEQMYNIFPFENSIAKMQLSGLEVQQLFDYVARRSAGRGCSMQAQIAGVRVRLNCTGCNRPGEGQRCAKDADCPSGATGSCDIAAGQPAGLCRIEPCAEQVFIGHVTQPDGSRMRCKTDQECADAVQGVCDRSAPNAEGFGLCLSPIKKTNLYELATSTYLAGGGSGYRVLQRNTTQFDTKIQQRDALIDYLRGGRPCGYKKENATAEGLKACANDGDCASEGGNFVCACNGGSEGKDAGGVFACETKAQGCDPAAGRCVLRACRDGVADFHNKRCASSPQAAACRVVLNACSLGGESCKILSCIDKGLGNFSDNRSEMIGR
jgi:5'-nucleotidase